MTTTLPPKSVWGKGPPAAIVSQEGGAAASSSSGAAAQQRGDGDKAKEDAIDTPPPRANVWGKGKLADVQRTPPAAEETVPTPDARVAAAGGGSAEQAAPTPQATAVKKSWAEMAKAKEAEAASLAPAQSPAPAPAATPPVSKLPITATVFSPSAPVFTPSSTPIIPEIVPEQPQHQPAKQEAVASTPQPAAEVEKDPEQLEAEKEFEAARKQYEGMIDSSLKGGTVERRMRGISNPGNLCFVNSVVQCMAGCMPLFRFVTGITTPIPAKMLTLVELSKILGEMMEEDMELGALTEAQTKGRNTGAIMGAAMANVVNEWVSDDPVRERGGKVRQEDAQEFLMHVLNALHDELARPSGGEGAADQEDSAKAEEEVEDKEADDDGWCQVGGKGGAKKTSVRKMRTERTLVTALFGLEVESVIRHSGNFASAVREPFTILSLDVRPSEVSTLEDALEHFLTPEKVEYDEKQRTKNMRVTSWPEILVIHLKRFFYDEKASMTNKVVKKIVYPEIFSVHSEGNGKASTSPAMRNYQLSSVLLHHGKQAGAGHYTSMVRLESERGDSWYKLDDESSSKVTIDDVLGQQQQVYLLFYKHKPSE